jgi:hypothetical protein
MKPAMTPAQAKTKDAYLRKHYGVTLDQFNQIRKHQDHKCAMCKRDEVDFKTNLAVDHCHISGLVRGLLCWLCNKRLGKFSDDHDLLRAAAEYVTNPTAILAGVQVHTAPGRIGTLVRAKALAKLNGTPTPKRRSKRAKSRRKRPAKG